LVQAKPHRSKLSSPLLAQLLRRGRKPASRQASAGFTLVELLVVVVILGVLGAVGVPAYFAQVNRARVNTANAAVMAAAKSCAATLVTGANTDYVGGTGVTGVCNASTADSVFTSDINPGPATRPATATVAANTGEVTLSQEAQ
jgi:prepilin-type N-terminal cleavage/methylation domain-containing protein